MLVYSTLDDNVPPNSTLLLIDALIKANKDFDLLALPNERHWPVGHRGGLSGSPAVGLFRTVPARKHAAEGIRDSLGASLQTKIDHDGRIPKPRWHSWPCDARLPTTDCYAS